MVECLGQHVVLQSDLGAGAQAGGISDAEMRRTFNLGIGMVLAVDAAAAADLLAGSTTAQPVVRLGEVVSGEGVLYAPR